MPYRDGTGPWGQGPMTGRRAGYCAGYDRPRYASQEMVRGLGRGYGRGMGRGRGPGRGLGQGFGRGPGYYGPTSEPPDPRTMPVYQEPSPEEEKKFLEALVKDLEAELEDVKARMTELAKENK